MTFEYWILHVARPGENPRGDFIRDTREAIGFGYNFNVDRLERLQLAMTVASHGSVAFEAFEDNGAEVIEATSNRTAAVIDPVDYGASVIETVNWNANVES